MPGPACARAAGGRAGGGGEGASARPPLLGAPAPAGGWGRCEDRRGEGGGVRGRAPPRARTKGASLRPQRGVRARASLRPRPPRKSARGGPSPTQKARGPAARASGSAEPGAARGGAELRGAGLLGKDYKRGTGRSFRTRAVGTGLPVKDSRGGRGLGLRASSEGRSREGEVESWAGWGGAPGRHVERRARPRAGRLRHPPRAVSSWASVRVSQRIPPPPVMRPACSEARGGRRPRGVEVTDQSALFL